MKTKISFNKISRNNTRTLVLMSVMLIITLALISSSLVSSLDVFAAKKSPRDICKINQDMCHCTNDIEFLSAHCCTFDTKGEAHCEFCDIDVKTGNYVNCTTSASNLKSANLPDNITVGGTFEQKEEEHNFDKGSNLDNTTIDITPGTFNEDSSSNNSKGIESDKINSGIEFN